MSPMGRAVLLCISAGTTTACWAAEQFMLTTIGNSITFSQPDPQKGWSGHWGMAATAEASDYSGQLAAMLAAQVGGEIDLQRFNHAKLERSPTYVAPEPALVARAKRSDLVVVELGDNALNGDEGAQDFGERLARLLAEVRPANGNLACVGTWWRKGKLDAAIRTACSRQGGTFVNLAGFLDRPENRGSAAATGATDAGVLSHPGDAGMRAIAAAIFQAVGPQLPAKR